LPFKFNLYRYTAVEAKLIESNSSRTFTLGGVGVGDAVGGCKVECS
jgi:hypothetical protein